MLMHAATASAHGTGGPGGNQPKSGASASTQGHHDAMQMPAPLA
jgi:hypothetical protein